MISLIKSKCVPILLYGIEASSPTVSDCRSLDFAMNRLLMKILKTIIQECQRMFNCLPIRILVDLRKVKFYAKLENSDNFISAQILHQHAAADLRLIGERYKCSNDLNDLCELQRSIVASFMSQNSQH